MDVNELRRKRAKCVYQARDILENTEKEGRSLNQDEDRQYSSWIDESNRLGDQIKRAEELREMERDFKDAPEDRGQTKPQEQRDFNQMQPREVYSSEEYRGSYHTYLRRGKNNVSFAEERALTVGTNTAGGYTVPTELENQITRKLEERNVMRQLGKVITTSGEHKIPIITDDGTAYWTAEGGAYTKSDMVFDQKTLDAHKATRLMPISEELLNDSAFDLDSEVSTSFANSVGDLEEAAMVNGDGAGKPTGFLVDATVGATTASGTDISSDELLDLFFALRRPYRRNAAWIMNDSTIKVVSKIKDGNGQYLWQPGLQAGVPDTLKGRPVHAATDMPSIALSSKSIAFGDFSYYIIGDRQGKSIQRLNELYAENGQVGFRAFQRVDAKLKLAEAIQVLQQAAA
jgi:HK97 family phage major capsid protein